MKTERPVRWGLLKAMYLYTLVGAGGFGLGVVLAPDWMRSVFSWPQQDPIVFGVTGSVYLAFGLLSVLGLRAPLRFAPLLLLQLSYKVIWMVAVVLPLFLAGTLPRYALLHVVVFASYIVGDLVAIPFADLFKRSEVPRRVRTGAV